MEFRSASMWPSSGILVGWRERAIFPVVVSVQFDKHCLIPRCPVQSMNDVCSGTDRVKAEPACIARLTTGVAAERYVLIGDGCRSEGNIERRLIPTCAIARQRQGSVVEVMAKTVLRSGGRLKWNR